MSKNKVFPIQSKTACLLKWSWSTVFLGTGKTSSCHRVDQETITPETFHMFHNTPGKLRAREMMRRGDWPQAGCQYCEEVEHAGGTSDRMYQLQARHHAPPHELDTDINANTVTPTILEIYFSNTCNMACLYCGPHFSSVWEAENNRHGEFAHGPIRLHTTKNVEFNQNYKRMLEEFWVWLENHYQHLGHLHILGGEPFYQKELEDVIAFIDTYPNPNMVLNLVSNLKVETKKFRKIIDQMMHLKNTGKLGGVQITGSLDCWGPQQEYVRWGLDLNEYTANMEYMLTQDITICINGAINALSIKTTAEYIEKMNYWNQLRKQYKPNPVDHIYYSFMTVNYPLYMKPDIFDSELFAEDFKRILSVMPQDTENQRGNYEHMKGIATHIAASTKNTEMINNLKVYLDEIDRRRGTNWKELFPWLEDCN